MIAILVRKDLCQMNRKFPHLCSPIKLGNVEFKSRMFAAPVGGIDITADCCVGRGTTAFYDLRAKGGAASVTVSELMVHPETDASHAFHLNLSTPGSMSGFALTADAIKRHGAIPGVELSHSGQYAGTYLMDKEKKQGLSQFGPSDGLRPDGLPVKALSKGQIAEITKAYGEAAALAKRAGFEMVMIHCGHGWLLNQFLSPYFNKRIDEYGGSFENRARFTLEVIDAVRNAVGTGFPIELRMSGSELFEGGYDLNTGVEIAKLIDGRVDLIHVSAGSYQFGFHITHPSMFEEHGCNVYLAAEIKKHVRTPVATLGGLNDPAQMEQIIATGQADVVEMGRALLADPYLPDKVIVGRDDEIVKCLRCFVCMAERAATQTRRCTVNPQIGRELDGIEITPVHKPKKVMIAGGGVAGMEAAITAAKRGHKVVLCEATDALGGILKSESAIPFKYEMYKLSVTMRHLMELENVEIRLNTTVTAKYAEAEHVDALIIAVGSEPLVPPLPGLDGENVVIVNNYYIEKEKVSDSVVVLGGGLAGCECAIHLAQEGKDVHLVEMRGVLAPDANIRHRPILMKKIDEFVTVHTNYRGLRVTSEGIVCSDENDDEQLVPGKTVICALGQCARRDAVDEMSGSAPVVKQIGDCIRPSNICNAVYQGYHAALDI